MQGIDDVRAPSSSCIAHRVVSTRGHCGSGEQCCSEINSVVAAQRLDQSCRRQRVGGLPDQFGETVVGGVERRESCNGTTPIGDDDLFTGLHPIGVAVDATRSIRP